MYGQLIHGAVLQSLPEPEKWIAWLNGEQDERLQPCSCSFEPLWALALCTNGVVWGRWTGNRWALGNTVYPEICPMVSLRNLQELRIFGLEGEALVWKDGAGLRGRFLADSATPADGEEGLEQELRPLIEKQVLIGNRVKDSRDGFIWVANNAGREQVLPFAREELPANSGGRRSPFRLIIKHYLSRDRERGTVRVIVSRLVDLKVVEA